MTLIPVSDGPKGGRCVVILDLPELRFRRDTQGFVSSVMRHLVDQTPAKIG